MNKSIGILLGLCSLACLAEAAPWKFGIIGDTQWSNDVDLKNPNSVAVGIINQVNKEMIRHGVTFVTTVGDITDKASSDAMAVAAIDTRVTYTQELYNAGIGFFPIRGNHEDSKTAAKEFFRVFPQTRYGIQNRTPDNAFNWTDSANIHPITRPENYTTFQLGSDFSSPNSGLNGLSYAFNYGNATFIMIDQFQDSTGASYGVSSTQQQWIDSVLENKPVGNHAFVFSHKGLIQSNHSDNLFSGITSDTAGTNTFIRSLHKHHAKFLFTGHDHVHEYSLIEDSDLNSDASVRQLIAASMSYKFYTPQKTPLDSANIKTFGFSRKTPVSQKLYDIGYYIVTVDGDNVTLDHYSVPSGSTNSISTTPELTGRWAWRERQGASLNGKEFIIEQGKTYTGVTDSYNGTEMKILEGVNTTTAGDYYDRKFRQLVNTGWSDADTIASLHSKILNLWGMNSTYSTDTTSTFVLSMNYDATANLDSLRNGSIALISTDTNDVIYWAVDRNKGGAPNFVNRAWQASDPLGTYGHDEATGTVWAVVNHCGKFAIAQSPFWKPIQQKVLDTVVVDEDAILAPISLSGLFSGINLTYTFKTSNAALVDVSGDTSSMTLALKENANGEAIITIEVTDENKRKTQATMKLTVNPLNDAPYVNNITDIDAEEDAKISSVNLSTVFGDVDDASLTYEIVYKNAAFADAEISTVQSGPTTTKKLLISLAENVYGKDSIIISATDTSGLSVLDTVIITVHSVNDVPVVAKVLSDVTTDEEETIADIDLSGVFSDVEDLENLTLSAVSSDTNLVQVGLTTDGKLNFRLKDNANGYTTIKLTATDSEGDSVITGFAVTVNAVNDAPEILAAFDAIVVDEDSILPTLAFSEHLGDIDGDELTYKVKSDDEDLVLAVNRNDSLILSLQPDAFGEALITVTAYDATDSVSVTLTVTVNAVNDLPVVAHPIQDIQVDEDALVESIDVSEVFSDVESATMPISRIENSNTTLLTLKLEDNKLHITLAEDSSGSATIRLYSQDNNEMQITDEFTITVSPVNDMPTVADILDSVVIDDTKTIAIHAEDKEGSVVSYKLVQSPMNGTVEFVSDSIKYTPDAGYYGFDWLKFSVTDNDGLSSENGFMIIFVQQSVALSSSSSEDYSSSSISSSSSEYETSSSSSNEKVSSSSSEYETSSSSSENTIVLKNADLALESNFLIRDRQIIAQQNTSVEFYNVIGMRVARYDLAKGQSMAITLKSGTYIVRDRIGNSRVFILK
ncbi:MAG: hypothetical protein AUK31_00270 [Fibrobacteres bacterium CG2_30_45_31]|nr:MAG: hypothetical protein AUK31_00270 [Fibrobacteres bacterium CG2_30_45_31]